MSSMAICSSKFILPIQAKEHEDENSQVPSPTGQEFMYFS